MTRERADNYDLKKQHILKRAAVLFAKRGYETTTMTDVAEACKASKSHIYHYFSAKEDILFAITDEHTLTLSDRLETAIEAAGTPEDKFSQFVEIFVEMAANAPNEQLVLTNDLKFLAAAKQKKIRHRESHIVDILVSIFVEMNPELMKAEHVRRPYALLLFGMIIWTFTWYKKSGEISPRELADRITDLFMGGIKHSALS